MVCLQFGNDSNGQSNWKMKVMVILIFGNDNQVSLFGNESHGQFAVWK